MEVPPTRWANATCQILVLGRQAPRKFSHSQRTLSIFFSFFSLANTHCFFFFSPFAPLSFCTRFFFCFLYFASVRHRLRTDSQDNGTKMFAREDGKKKTVNCTTRKKIATCCFKYLRKMCLARRDIVVKVFENAQMRNTPIRSPGGLCFN